MKRFSVLAAVVCLAMFLVMFRSWPRPLALSEDAIPLPKKDPLALKELGRLVGGPGSENSGIVKSRKKADLYWIINDSGNPPALHPVHEDGTNYTNSQGVEHPGVSLVGAINIDWEDITADSAGNLIVSDLGNNSNARQNLTLYIVPEPDPSAEEVKVAKEILVHYPDQVSFPAAADNFNFDCEAIFTVGTEIYVLTKHRSNTLTRLYRLKDPQAEGSTELSFVEQFDIQGQVTGADMSVDGLELLVLTYRSVWYFQRESIESPFFGGEIRWGPFKLPQAESICWGEDGEIVLGCEQRDRLYQIMREDLHDVTELASKSEESP